MAKINPYNQAYYTCGVGGGGQSIHVRDTINQKWIKVLSNSAGSQIPGGPTWIDAESVVGQLCEVTCKLVKVNIYDRMVDTLIADGINLGCSGGGRFSAIALGGTYINGKRRSGIEPIVYGPDGTLAYTNPAHQGLWLLNTDESVDYVSTRIIDQESIHVLGYRKLIWMDSGSIKSTWPVTIKNLKGDIGWTRGVIVNRLLHVMYHHYNTNKVLFHPWNSLQGWVFGEGLCYYPDIQLLLDGSVFAIYNHVANDNFDSIVEVLDPMSKPAINLESLL